MENGYKIGESLYNDDPVIRTFTGKYVNVFYLKPDDIDILDIAHSLSLKPRWGGFCQNFYNVAEHSIRVAEIVPPEYKLAALLHDASEAYLTDLPSPIKRYFPEYRNLEEKIDVIIADKFGFEYPFRPEIKMADQVALEEEWNAIMLDYNNSYECNWKESRDKFCQTYLKYIK